MKAAFKVWKTIKVGVYENLNQILKNLEHKEVLMEKDFMIKVFESNSLYLSKEKEDVNLALISLKDLGFRKNDDLTYRNICEVALSQSLHLCLTQDAFYLREQYLNQPLNSEIIVATMPLLFDESQVLVSMMRYSRIYSKTEYLFLGLETHVEILLNWNLETLFVFRLKK